jgi:hypothetical protein
LVFTIFREFDKESKVIQEVELNFFVGKGEIFDGEAAFGEDTGKDEVGFERDSEIEGVKAGGDFAGSAFEEIIEGGIVEEGELCLAGFLAPVVHSGER